MKKLSLILDQTNWLEATWTENHIQVHCESFSGHREHIAMLRDKAKDFGTSLDEYEDLIKQAEDAYVYPTAEELAKQELNKKIQEAKAYLSSTDYKMTSDYDKDVTEVTRLRAEARELLRQLEGGH